MTSVARGDQLLGAAPRSGCRGVDLDQAEVAAGVVDAHVEAAVAMVEVVFDVGAAREDDAQRERRVGARVGVERRATSFESLLSLPSSR